MARVQPMLKSELGTLAVPRPGSHIVQFYERDDFLFDAVANFLAGGIVAGQPVVVVATEDHWAGFCAALSDKGFDSDSVTFVDAHQALSKFMNGPMPDEQQFMTTIGGILQQAMDRFEVPVVRAYGEMVDLLWRSGNAEAAVRVEELWNEIGQLYDFALLCAYPMGNFYKETDAALFDEVCRTHTHVTPAEGYNRATDEDARHREIAALQQRAAALAAEVEHRRELERALREALASRRTVEEELRANLDSLRRASEENARLYELAQQTNRTKDEFLATLSHELRTPLTAILGWARMLTLGGIDEKTMRTAIETIERSARTQAALIDDLLDLSRIVTGKLTLRREPVDLGAAVDASIETVKLAAEGRGVHLRVNPSPRRCIINGDATRLQQIAWNLISNAVKFSSSGGEVTATVVRNGETAKLIVSDQGRGITPEFLPHVFEPFRQADAANTRAHTGLGLGLAIVKYLAELHGGSVHAASDGPGKGATFTIILPLAARTSMQPAPIAHSDVADLSGLSILVVDDDSDARAVVTAILQRCGASVEAVDSVESAFEHLRSHLPHVIVTDIAMPHEDGIALLQRLQTDIPAVALTAIADAGAEQRLRDAGFRAYVRKPVDPVRLSRVIADLRA